MGTILRGGSKKENIIGWTVIAVLTLLFVWTCNRSEKREAEEQARFDSLLRNTHGGSRLLDKFSYAHLDADGEYGPTIDERLARVRAIQADLLSRESIITQEGVATTRNQQKNIDMRHYQISFVKIMIDSIFYDFDCVGDTFLIIRVDRELENRFSKELRRCP